MQIRHFSLNDNKKNGLKSDSPWLGIFPSDLVNCFCEWNLKIRFSSENLEQGISIQLYVDLAVRTPAFVGAWIDSCIAEKLYWISNPMELIRREFSTDPLLASDQFTGNFTLLRTRAITREIFNFSYRTIKLSLSEHLLLSLLPKHFQ